MNAAAKQKTYDLTYTPLESIIMHNAWPRFGNLIICDSAHAALTKNSIYGTVKNPITIEPVEKTVSEFGESNPSFGRILELGRQAGLSLFPPQFVVSYAAKRFAQKQEGHVRFAMKQLGTPIRDVAGNNLILGYSPGMVYAIAASPIKTFPGTTTFIFCKIHH